MKLSPFYTALAHLAGELDRAHADGLVLFNRFYQPDIDAEELTAGPPHEVALENDLIGFSGLVRCQHNAFKHAF